VQQKFLGALFIFLKQLIYWCEPTVINPFSNQRQKISNETQWHKLGTNRWRWLSTRSKPLSACTGSTTTRHMTSWESQSVVHSPGIDSTWHHPMVVRGQWGCFNLVDDQRHGLVCWDLIVSRCLGLMLSCKGLCWGYFFVHLGDNWQVHVHVIRYCNHRLAQNIQKSYIYMLFVLEDFLQYHLKMSLLIFMIQGHLTV
jgi:hypothetical protein